MTLPPDLELRLARLSKDLAQLQRTVQELLSAFDPPRVARRTHSRVESAQYAVLQAALRTSEATPHEARERAQEHPVRASSRSKALRT